MGSQAQVLTQDQQHTTKTTSTQGGILQCAAVIPAITPVHSGILQRCSGGVECAECREKRLEREGMMQRAAVNAAPVNDVPPIVHEVLNSPGQPLDAETQAFMEPRFGYDFSQVRVHTDAKAAESARAVNALAYTVGRDVVFGKGEYAPGRSEGRRLLTHELTHVVQQSGESRPIRLSIGQAHDSYEREADTITQAIVSSSIEHPFSSWLGSSGLLLQRQATSDDELDQINTEPEEDDTEAHDGDMPVIGIDTSEDSGEQIETDETMLAEVVNPESQEVILAQAEVAGKGKPKVPVPAKKTPPKKITRIDIDLGEQKLKLNWSDGTKSKWHTISSGKGLPNTADDPCKTQGETNCTPVGDLKITSKGDENTTNKRGDRMPWYAGFVDKRGIGIHGGQLVTGKPASHGCIRIDNANAKLINQYTVKGKTEVHVFGKAPTVPWKKPPPKKSPPKRKR